MILINGEKDSISAYEINDNVDNSNIFHYDKEA